MITLICGLPRAGKTTYSQKYENTCKVIHTDNIGSSQNLMNIIKHYDDVVVEGIFRIARFRELILRSRKDEFSRCIWIDTPIEVRKSRANYSPFGGERFEPPTLDEGWDEIIIIRGNDEQRISRETEN